MANLPNKPFVFNYNARDYDPASFTIPKTSGQTMDYDFVYTGTGKTGITKSNNYITLPASATSQINFSTSGANPLNLTASDNNLTLVFKAKYVYNGSYDLRGDFMNNQATRANWMVRIGARENYSTSLTKISFTYNDTTVTWDTGLAYTCGDTITGAIVVDNGSFVIKNLGTAESTTAISIPNNGGYGAGVETLKSYFTGDFYWCYASREVLTDEEIQQVVRYNDSKFGPDTTGSTIAASGGTETTNLDSETGWTATTTSPWITISPASGESGTTAITFTIKKNLFSQRTGVVTFTSDAGDVAEYTITQEGQDKVAPINKMYQGTRRIN